MLLIYDTITTNFEGENTFDLSVPWVWAQYKQYKMHELLELDLTNQSYD